MAGATAGTLGEWAPVEAPVDIATEAVEYFGWCSRDPSSVRVTEVTVDVVFGAAELATPCRCSEGRLRSERTSAPSPENPFAKALNCRAGSGCGCSGWAVDLAVAGLVACWIPALD